MKICIIGTGHVGLVTGACFADLGNAVICIDRDTKKIEGLKKCVMPFYEPGLEELVVRNVREKRLSFSSNLKEGVKKSEIIFIAVGTPSRGNSEADLSYVEGVSAQIARAMDSYKLIVEKSTVPVQTGRWVEHTIKANNRGKVKFDVASNPEFLREGSAVNDFMHPDRIVLGVESKMAKDILVELYRPLRAPMIITDIESAEIIKHASNSFLATKLSFINAIANLCELTGADVVKVAEGIGKDSRIGSSYLDAGLGFGGPCLPKDLAAFIQIAERAGYNFELLKAVERINAEQKRLLVKKIEDALWVLNNKTIAVLGLSFKPDTDDIRSSPSIEIIQALRRNGAKIKAFDPQAMRNAAKVLSGVKFCRDAYDAARGSDCLVILTDWNEFKELDINRIKKLLRKPLIVDGRNIYHPGKMKELGFQYFGIGRGNEKKGKR